MFATWKNLGGIRNKGVTSSQKILNIMCKIVDKIEIMCLDAFLSKLTLKTDKFTLFE